MSFKPPPAMDSLRPPFLLVTVLAAAWTVYLGTLCPTIFFRDSPELINTAFALGVSHPAGFPTYNLLAKAVTFLPLGSVAFRVNLFSVLTGVAALTLVYAAALMGLRLFAGDGEDRQRTWAAALATGCLAFSGPFWEQSRVAEVYTLHTAFTAGVILLLLLWRIKEDVRFLYAAALTYGLSAGNHATVAFYLPGILVLFFCWSGRYRWRDLTRCVLLFLAGLSVFLYLPVRSMAEPSFDFGNPETMEGFIFQVTDRKDADYHFSLLRDPGKSSQQNSSSSEGSLFEGMGEKLGAIFNRTWMIGKLAALDLTHHLSPLSALGILAGGFLCWRRSRPLVFFFLIIAGVNIIFFYSWRKESYLPTYIVATILTALALHHFLKYPEGASQPRFPDPATKSMPSQEKEVSNLEASGEVSLNWRRLVWTILVLWIPFTIVVKWPRLDLSREYNAETLPRRLFLTLDDRSVFIPGASWFYYWYFQDVHRLRDDVTAVTVLDLLSPKPPDFLTSRRYPDLALPQEGAFDFGSEEEIAAYAGEFLKLNGGRRPLLMEHNWWFYEHTLWTDLFQPHRSLFIRYAPEKMEGEGLSAWREFVELLEDELNRPGAGREREWITLPSFWMESWALFARETRRFELEGAILKVMMNFLGLPLPKVELQWVENRFRLGEDDEAKAALERLIAGSPDTYEAWMARARLAREENRLMAAVLALEEAVRKKPDAMAAYWEQVLVYRRLGRLKEARAAEKQAGLAVSNLREWNLVHNGLTPEPSFRAMSP